MEGLTLACFVVDWDAASRDVSLVRGVWDVLENDTFGEGIADLESRHLVVIEAIDLQLCKWWVRPKSRQLR